MANRSLGCILLVFFIHCFMHINTEEIPVKGIFDRLGVIEGIVNKQQNEVRRLNNENSDLRLDIESLKRKDEVQTGIIADLTKAITAIKRENERLSDEIVHLDKLVPKTAALPFQRILQNTSDTTTKTDQDTAVLDHQMEEQNKDDEDDLKVTEKHSEEHENNTGRIRRATSELPVAFFATLSLHADHLGLNQVLAFDNALTNIGNAYHPTVGVFTTPITGVYVFSVTLLTTAYDAAHFQFTVNGKQIASQYVRLAGDSTSQTIVLHLNTGDDVAIRHVDSNKKVHGYDYSSFSGFLLATTPGNQEANIIG